MLSERDRERDAIFARCERFLSRHPRRSPREVLAALAREVGEDEQADVYGRGDLIGDLEREVAGLLGKPAAVFMPSGTMAQQIALRIHAQRRACNTVAFHPTCHLELHEQQGYQFLHGLRSRRVGNPHRTITLADLKAVAEPLAALLLELPQREIGGRLPSWEELVAQAGWARAHEVALHMDGARLWECAPFYGRSHAEIAGLFDSVYVSFYKILGGLAGAMLVGDEALVAEARVWLRRHGGNLYALYPYVLAARVGLRERLPRVAAYCERARAVAAILGRIPGVTITPDPPHTNMMHLLVGGDRERLLDASAAIAEEEGICLLERLQACDHPGYHLAEIVVGEAAFALSDAEIERLFRRVVQAG